MARKPLQLGRPVRLPASPDKAQLDRVPNPHRDTNYVARFTAPEFTCLCPITGQPDFAHLVIDYVPGAISGGVEVAQALSRQLPQPRRLPRGLHGRHRQAAGRAAQAEIAAHRRLLVSARRHADRRVLAGRALAEGRLAARPGRRALSRARLGHTGVGAGRRSHCAQVNPTATSTTAPNNSTGVEADAWTGPRHRRSARPPARGRRRTNAAPWPSRAPPAQVRWRKSGSRRAACRSRSRAARNWRTRPAKAAAPRSPRGKSPCGAAEPHHARLAEQRAAAATPSAP